MSAKISVACPHCGNSGPHPQESDVPDPALNFYAPLACAGCGFEFTVDTRTGTVRALSNAAGLADLQLIDAADTGDPTS